MKQYQRKSDALVVSEKSKLLQYNCICNKSDYQKIAIWALFLLQCTVEFRTNRFYLHLAKINMCNFLGIPFADFIIRAPLALSTKMYWMKELKGYGLSYWCISNRVFKENLNWTYQFSWLTFLFFREKSFPKTNKKKCLKLLNHIFSTLVSFFIEQVYNWIKNLSNAFFGWNDVVFD